MPRQTIHGWRDACPHCHEIINLQEGHFCQVLARRDDDPYQRARELLQLAEQRHERRQGRARRRRKLEELEARVAQLSQENHSLQQKVWGLRGVLNSIACLRAVPGDHSNFGVLEMVITWAQRTVYAVSSVEREDRDA